MKRFFSDSSFWNQPVGPNPEIDPDSSRYIALLSGERGGPFKFNSRTWTVPVYEVDASTPLRAVRQRLRNPKSDSCSAWRDREKYWSHGPGFGEGVPIPDCANPDPEEDSHMAIVDWGRGLVWDMWGCRRRPDGEWESNTGMRYSVQGEGVWKTSDFAVKDGESVHFHGPGRASGVPVVAGLAMREEILAGSIRHKLAMATWHNAYKRFVFPASWTDGFRDDGLPEGALVQLDPSLDLSVYGLSPAALCIAKALQEYGMVNVDNAGANAIYVEQIGVHGLSWDGVLSDDEISRIPLSKYRVLKLGPATAAGCSWHREEQGFKP